MKTRDSVITRLAHLLPSSNKNVQVGMSTVMLNYVVAGTIQMSDEETQVQCLTTIGILFLEGLSEIEAMYRYALVHLIILLWPSTFECFLHFPNIYYNSLMGAVNDNFDSRRRT